MDNRKSIKIAFRDYWGSFYENEMDDCLIMRILRKHYDVEVCDDADYVFFSTMGESHWSVPDKCIKIYQTGENIVPDFNACDYAIGFEWMEYEDRYIRFPNYMFYDRELLRKMEHKHELPEDWSLEKCKPEFCSFVVSNHRNPKRKVFFDRLSEYKKVNSGGGYMNNIGGPVDDKVEFESKHRFSICFENGSHNGYTTEKLIQALAARTVPIYWGDPKVDKVFNTEAFINAYSFESMDAVVDCVRELDNNPDAYMAMIHEPALLPSSPSIEDELDRFEAWLVNIFEQPIELAKRRNREMHGRWYIERRYRLDPKGNKIAIMEMRKTYLKKVLAYLKRKIFKNSIGGGKSVIIRCLVGAFGAVSILFLIRLIANKTDCLSKLGSMTLGIYCIQVIIAEGIYKKLSGLVVPLNPMHGTILADMFFDIVVLLFAAILCVMICLNVIKLLRGNYYTKFILLGES